MVMPVADGRKSVIKVRVNEHNKIMLDGKIDGKRYRLSSGKEANKRNLDWYSSHADDEFFKLYKKKYDIETPKLVSFKEYGLKVLELTSDDRSSFSQKEELQRFNTLCQTFGKYCITTIKPSDIKSWQKNCGYARKTILNYRSTLYRIFQMAYDDELINRNPLTSKTAKAPKRISVDPEKETIRILTEKEIEILLKNTKNKQYKHMLLFNLVTGLRVSEVIALEWDHIDFDNKSINIKQRIREGDIDIPKKGSFRKIDMLPIAYEALKAQWNITQKSKFVFLTQYGKPYKTPNMISKQLKKLCEKCNIEPATFKTTRKTCNTMYKELGCNIDWILQHMGHKEEHVNRKHYTGKIKADEEKTGRLLAGLKINL